MKSILHQIMYSNFAKFVAVGNFWPKYVHHLVSTIKKTRMTQFCFRNFCRQQKHYFWRVWDLKLCFALWFESFDPIFVCMWHFENKHFYHFGILPQIYAFFWKNKCFCLKNHNFGSDRTSCLQCSSQKCKLSPMIQIKVQRITSELKRFKNNVFVTSRNFWSKIMSMLVFWW